VTSLYVRIQFLSSNMRLLSLHLLSKVSRIHNYKFFFFFKLRIINREYVLLTENEAFMMSNKEKTSKFKIEFF